jgi:hypothetical protein
MRFTYQIDLRKNKSSDVWPAIWIYPFYDTT